MDFPKLKNALLCRILVYVLVIGAFAVPVIIVALIDAVPMPVKLCVLILSVLGLLAYAVANFGILMYMDAYFAQIRCYQTARKRFALPSSFSADKTEKKISHFGRACDIQSFEPRPSALRYRNSSSATVYASSIEKVIAVYHTDFLDIEEYRRIYQSARVNSKAVAGRKPNILDHLNNNQDSPVNKVTVVMIFAKKTDAEFRREMFEKICSGCGDGFDKATVPCVIDLEDKCCVFNSLREPYIGYQYPVKNRGIRLVRKFVFGGKLPLTDNERDMLDDCGEMQTERSLWSFWMEASKKLGILGVRKLKKRFEKMENGEICFEKDSIYIKTDGRGVEVFVEVDEDKKTVSTFPPEIWDYPKDNSMSKKKITEVENMIVSYFADRGYTAVFLTEEDDGEASD